MAQENLRFYNMIVHLVQNNRLFEENVAVKNVWQKDNNLFFDIYFYRNQKSYVFDAAFIHDLLDLTTEKYYGTLEAFVKDYQKEETLEAPAVSENKFLIDKKIFEPLNIDLVILTFMAQCGGNFSAIKEKIIYDYILDQIPETRSLSRQYINAYLTGIKPSVENFYKAINHLNTKNPDEASELVKESVKICLSDGQLHYIEKLYLAEIFQVLREQGVEPDVGL